jgi:D-aspartate ligase
MNTALVISGHTMGLAVIRGLTRAHVPVVLLTYEKMDAATASRYVQKSIAVPHPSKQETEFVEALKAVIACYPDAIVFPASDASLSAVSRHKAEIEAQGCQLACPEWEVTRLFLDKIHTYELAEEIGVPAPKTRLIRSLEDIEIHRDSFLYPCIVKPHQSHLFYATFHTKMFLVNNADELSSRLQDALNANLDVMVQEIVQGPDSNGANYNSYHYDGQALVEFTARKVRSGPPRFGSPRVLLTQDIPEIKEPGRRILTAMNFDGFQCTEFKRDERDGIYKLLDINGRHNLSAMLAAMLAIATGINFPYLHYQHLASKLLPEPLDYQKDVYWIDFLRDLGYSLKYFGKEDNSLRDFLRPYFHRHVFAILSLKDPKPFIKRLAQVLKGSL